MDKVNVLGVNVDMVNTSEAVDVIMNFLKEDRLHSVFTPNSEIIMKAYKDPGFAGVLNRSDLLTADGIGVVYASKILKKPLSERATGYDMALELMSRIKDTDHTLFLFGGKPGVAEEAEEKLKEKYPGLKISGCRDGYFKPEDEDGIIKEINDSGADIVFVCLGAPKQELWIDKYHDRLKAKVAMGIGGSLDGFSGRAERAPEFYRKHGLEWFYRLKKEPWRYKRMLELPKFALTVLVKGKKYKQS